MKTFSNFQIKSHFHPDASSGIDKLLSLTACLLVLITLKSEQTFSQEIRWQNTIGGGSTDLMTSIKQTSDGGFILGGWSLSGLSGDKTENSQGGSDFWIVKTDGSGNILWQNTIGGSLDDRLSAIELTSDGGFLVGGTSNSGISGDKSENSKGGDDVWIVKIDSIGAIQWQKTIGGSDFDGLYSMQHTTDGGFILGCNSRSNISGDKSEACLGDRDFWIVKIDSLGNIMWENTIGGSDDEKLNAVQQTIDGGFVIGGASRSNISGDKTEDSWRDTYDYWLVKTDSLGVIEWQNTIGGAHYDELISVNQTADGGYILGGRSQSKANGNKTENVIGMRRPDYWVLKTNDHGYIQWQNTIGGNDQDDIINVHCTNDGGYLLVGYSYSNTYADKDEDNRGRYWADLWVLKIDSVGNIIWQNSIGGKKDDVIYASTITSDGNLVLGGSSESMKTGDKNEDCNGDFDFWLLKLTDQYNLLTGKIYLDLNSNMVQDSGEPSLTNRKILQNTSHFSFSNLAGSYRVAVVDTGYFKVYGPSIPDFNTIPPFHSANFNSFNQIDSLNDFAIQPNGLVQNLKLSMVAVPPFTTWMTSDYYLYYENNGNNLVSADIVFYPDTSLDILGIWPTPSIVTPDSLFWSGLSLMPFNQGKITLQVQVKAGTPLNTPINAMARIEPLVGDLSPADNIAVDSSVVFGSFDPNSISVDKPVITLVQLTDTVWLEYLIQFQNTGNDTAINVQVVNRINRTLLEPSSFEFISSSHPLEISWVNYKEEMIFSFDSILLPDSIVNEPKSHGYIKYRIKPDVSLGAGDTIFNNAEIYFDFNPAILTNTATTIISFPTGLSNLSPAPGKLLVFPNPAENSINISGIQLENGKAQLRLMDIYGKLILEKTISETTAYLETDQLANGVYLVESGERRATFVKQ